MYGQIEKVKVNGDQNNIMFNGQKALCTKSILNYDFFHFWVEYPFTLFIPLKRMLYCLLAKL